MTHVFVIHQFECQRREFLFIRSFAACWSIGFRIHTCYRRNIGRCWQVFNNRVQHTLYTFVFKCRTTQYRLDFASQSTGTQSRHDFFFGQRFAAQVFFHQVFIGFGSSLNHFFTPFFSNAYQISRNVSIVESQTLSGIVPHNGFHFQQVNHALEAFFCTDRYHYRYWVGAQTGFHLLNHTEEVCTLTVHFVHKCQAWNLVFVGLAPYSFRLRLYATHCTVNHYRTVQYTHRTLYFYSKVYVSWGVNHVETVFRQCAVHTFPECGHSSRSNGNTTLLLLFHPVSCRCTVMHFTQFVSHACVEQNTF